MTRRDNNKQPDDSLPDDDVSRRLARLRERLMDTSALKHTLDARLHEDHKDQDAHERNRYRILTWLTTPARAVAASVLLSVLVAGAVFLTWTSGPAVASPADLAQVHRSAVAREGHSTVVSTIDEARNALRQKWSAVPEVPEPESMRAMSCCVHDVGRERLACVTFMIDNEPVTLAIAHAAEVCSPEGKTFTMNGETYLIGAADEINMVMTRRGDVWTCMMGRLPVERLAVLSAGLRD